jgi:hypothetical protein
VGECGAGTTLTIAYDHLNNEGRPKEKDFIKGGALIGTVYDLDPAIKGEKDHLHFGICRGVGCNPQVGAVTQSNFPGSFINPWITTNPGLYM